MARTGRPAKPIGLLKKTGQFRKGRHDQRVDPPPGVPEFPDYLDEGLRVWWDEIVESLAEWDVLCRSDRLAMVMLCEALGRYFEARDVYRKDGIVRTTPQGEVQGIGWKAVNDAWERVVKALREFGLTPSARASVRITKKPPKGPANREQFFGIKQTG